MNLKLTNYLLRYVAEIFNLNFSPKSSIIYIAELFSFLAYAILIGDLIIYWMWCSKNTRDSRHIIFLSCRKWRVSRMRLSVTALDSRLTVWSLKVYNVTYTTHLDMFQQLNKSTIPYDDRTVYYSLLEISLKHVELKTFCRGFNFNISTPFTFIYCKPYHISIITLIKLNWINLLCCHPHQKYMRMSSLFHAVRHVTYWVKLTWVRIIETFVLILTV